MVQLLLVHIWWMALVFTLHLKRMHGCLFEPDAERKMRSVFAPARSDFVIGESTLVKGFRVMKFLYGFVIVLTVFACVLDLFCW